MECTGPFSDAKDCPVHSPQHSNDIFVSLNRAESIALHKLLVREFIPHEYYEEIHSILNKINAKLAR